LRSVFDSLLNLLGLRVENQQPGTLKADSLSGISAIFARDIERQQYDHLNKPTTPQRDSKGVREHNQFLQDGAGIPPHHR
jgi:hypothetical protein